MLDDYINKGGVKGQDMDVQPHWCGLGLPSPDPVFIKSDYLLPLYLMGGDIII